MYFVGREKEAKQIIKALERGENVILTGKYGMGRTSLIKKVAEVTQGRWRFVFVDFSQTPGRVCQLLMDELLPKSKGKKRGEILGYKANRFRISHLDFLDRRSHVLVLDNIAHLSAQKLDLIQYLISGGQFRFVAIVEAFVPENDLFRLRAWLRPALRVELPHLRVQNAREFFQYAAMKHHLNWTKSQIESLAEATRGYPLGMREVVNRGIASSRGLGVLMSLPRVKNHKITVSSGQTMLSPKLVGSEWRRQL
jgi:hypothetical protein